MASDLYVLVKLVLGEDPVNWILSQREGLLDGVRVQGDHVRGKSWAEIAAELSLIIDRRISGETVRQWVVQHRTNGLIKDPQRKEAT